MTTSRSNFYELKVEPIVIPYPIMLDLEGELILVVGGGPVAHRKVESLLEVGAHVVVVAPEVIDPIREMAEDSLIEFEQRDFYEGIFVSRSDIRLVFGATNDREVNMRVYRSASENRIPCNIADVPDLCSFIVPAVVRSGDVLVAISTGGASPALARRIRKELQKAIGPEYGMMAKLMAVLRAEVLKLDLGSEENKKIFTLLVESDILEQLRDLEIEKVKGVLAELLPSDIDISLILAEAGVNGTREE